MPKKIAIIDTAHHRQTGASKFIIGFLTPFYDIDLYWDESNSDKDEWKNIFNQNGDYESVVIFQSTRDLRFYRTIDCPSIVCIPNIIIGGYQSNQYYPEKFKYLCMSKAQYKVLSFMGRNCFSIQYYPNPYGFPSIRDYSSLKGFFWCRSPEVTPEIISQLTADAEIASLHIHDAAIPGVGSLVELGNLENRRVSWSRWFKKHSDYLELIKDANIFFAPRLFEVVPNAILEAMSLGMCVVAPDLPAANEYLRDGENGLLYDPDDPVPLDFSKADSIGRNARKSVELGFERWTEQRREIFEYLTGTLIDQWDWTEVIEPQFMAQRSAQKKIGHESLKPTSSRKANEGCKKLFNDRIKSPSLTVATVVRNSKSNLEKTIKSVLSQSFDDLEYIIVDGKSDDGTLEIIRKYESQIDYWTSEKDEGPYHAMNKAVEYAKGKYILFLNAGDWFATSRVLEQVFENVWEAPDIVYGDHIWLKNGTPNFHKSLPFSAIQGILSNGKYQTATWYQGLPNHQSTFVKTSLLRKWPFDTKYKLAADYDFLFKMACKGLSFMQIDILISVYPSGGISGQYEHLLHQEWKQIFDKYGNKGFQKVLGSEKYEFAKCIHSTGMHINENFAAHKYSIKSSQFNDQIKALNAVNTSARVYLTTPCLNAIDTIDQTILSVVSQCGSNYVVRYHIQDGGSTDGTVERLKEWKRMLSASSSGSLSGKWKNVIFSFASEADGGMYEAISRGFEFMDVPHAAIMSWINADDILFPGAIATMVRLFRQYPQVSWVTGHNCLISYKGEVIGYNDEAKPGDYIKTGFCDGVNWRFVQQEGIFFRKWLWDTTGGFDEKLKYAADWDLWRRFAEHADLVHFPGPIAAFRLRHGQISRSEIKKYMEEIDHVVPFRERSEAANRLTTATGINLQVASIYFRNNVYSLEERPLGDFRIPHEGRKLFSNAANKDAKKKNASSPDGQERTAQTAPDSSNVSSKNTSDIKAYEPCWRGKMTAPQHITHSDSITFAEGWGISEKAEGGWVRYLSGQGIIHLKSDCNGKAKISFCIGSTIPKNTTDLVLNGNFLKAIEVDLAIETVTAMPIKVKAGTNILCLSSRLTSKQTEMDIQQGCIMVGRVSFTSPGFGLKWGKGINALKLKQGLFYEQYYSDQVTGIEHLKITPVVHYLLYGAWEGKDPNPLFSSNFYLNKNRDVYLSGMNPLLHYILHGWLEGRDPHPDFSTQQYLDANEDVRKSGMNPLAHYLSYGIIEKREICPSILVAED